MSRCDERARHSGRDEVRDGRHRMAQPDAPDRPRYDAIRIDGGVLVSRAIADILVYDGALTHRNVRARIAEVSGQLQRAGEEVV